MSLRENHRTCTRAMSQLFVTKFRRSTRIATASNWCKGHRTRISGPLLPITF